MSLQKEACIKRDEFFEERIVSFEKKSFFIKEKFPFQKKHGFKTTSFAIQKEEFLKQENVPKKEALN